jgi:hypothetical protein
VRLRRASELTFVTLICVCARSKSIAKEARDANRNKLFKKRDQQSKAYRKEMAKNGD